MRFLRLEQQVEYIKHNVKPIMVALRNKLGMFGEDGDSNAEKKLEWGSRDWEDIENQPKKESQKDQPSSNVMNQSLFKMETKFNSKPYHGEIDALKLNHWL